MAPLKVVRRFSVAALLVLCVYAAVEAQFGRFFRAPPRFPTAASFDGGFNFCRAMFTSVRREPGGRGWSTDYPSADINFSIRLSELTRARVKKDADGTPDHVVVRLTDAELFKCPLIQMSDVGTLEFTDQEVEALRAYLLKGGVLWVDDFWGTYAWDEWIDQIARVLPEDEYVVADVPLDHPMYRILFNVPAVPQIPSIQFWRSNGGATSERGGDSATAHMRSISNERGDPMVIMTYNTDIADAWEREGEDVDYFYQFSPDGYAVGINLVLYVMTH